MTTEYSNRQMQEEQRVLAEKRRRDELQFFAFLSMLLKGFGAKPENVESSALSNNPTEEEIISHPLFRQAHPERSAARGMENNPLHFNQAANASLLPRQSVFSDQNYADTALRTALSLGIERYTDDCKARGVKYGFGVKDGKNSIDCSGFVQKSIQSILASTGMADQAYARMFQTHADGQVQALSQLSKYKLHGDQVNLKNLKAGMVIGIDSGDRKWDRGRTDGIDHIGIVYADSKTGKLMFAESRGGVGVMTTPLEDYLKQAQKQGYKLFAADVAGLASDDFKNKLEAGSQKHTLQAANSPRTTNPILPVT